MNKINNREASHTIETLSPWWRRASLLTMALGFAVLILLTFKAYHEVPPIPDKVTDTGGAVLYTGADIRAGQQVFLKYGLMDNGTIWGHGALLGPDFSTEYLHTLALYEATNILAYTGSDLARLLEWCRMPGDLVFIIFGVVPIAIAALRACLNSTKRCV